MNKIEKLKAELRHYEKKYEELKAGGYSVLKVKNNGLYSLYCRKKQVFEGRRGNE